MSLSEQQTKYEYQFTGQMQSCNDIDIANDIDPSVSFDGIVKTIEFSQRKESKTAFSSNTVFVSNSLTELITAFILYGSGQTELNLFISPYLNNGKNPNQIENTENGFSNFLEKLKEIIYTAETGIQNKFKINEFTSEIAQEWYAKLPNKINLILPSKKIIFTKVNEKEKDEKEKDEKEKDKKNGINRIDEIVVENNEIIEKYKTKNGYYYSYEKEIKVSDNVPNTVVSGLYGNLIEFMKWFESDNNYYKQQFINTNLIHVVTNSQLMQKYLKIDTNKNTTNMWRFKTILKNETPQDIFIVEGVEFDKKNSKQMEISNAHTLCKRKQKNSWFNGGKSKKNKKQINKNKNQTKKNNKKRTMKYRKIKSSN
jgi:hypothetical protein